LGTIVGNSLPVMLDGHTKYFVFGRGWLDIMTGINEGTVSLNFQVEIPDDQMVSTVLDSLSVIVDKVRNLEEVAFAKKRDYP